MPLRQGEDSAGKFYMWGDVKGHKYYYKNERERKVAKKKAINQAIAAAYSMAERCSQDNPAEDGRRPPDYCSYERRIVHPGSTLREREAKATRVPNK